MGNNLRWTYALHLVAWSNNNPRGSVKLRDFFAIRNDTQQDKRYEICNGVTSPY